MDEVDKSIANIARIVIVNGQVEEVELNAMVFIDFLEEHFFSILVGDVPDHDGGPSIILYLSMRAMNTFSKLIRLSAFSSQVFFFLKGI